MGTHSKANVKAERNVKVRKATGGPADWSGVDPQVLINTIAVVAVRGGALRFGYTRDGGAYAIGVYGDGDPYTLYCKPTESVEDYLDDIRDGFENLPIRASNPR